MTDNPGAQELLEQIRSFIAATQAHVAKGGDADLTGLDGKVQELCDAVLDMPKPEADVFLPQFEALMGELDALKAGLVKARDEVQAQVQALNLRQKAARAYKTGEATKPDSKKTD